MSEYMLSLPMVALRGMTILPEMVVHFDVSREKSIEAIQEAMVEEQKIFLVAQKNVETEEPTRDDVSDRDDSDYQTGNKTSEADSEDIGNRGAARST